RHLLFLEGTAWSDNFDGLDEVQDEQTVYAPHFYKPPEFTLHFDSDLSYPGVIAGRRWDKKTLRQELARFAELGRKMQRPILIGEFGVNSRCPSCHAERRWVRDTTRLFKAFGFHWCYWAYKTLGSTYFPNGLVRLSGHPDWLRRESATPGWEN